MSENFEKIVLEKLDNLENTQNNIIDRLDTLEKGQEDLKNNQKVANERLDRMESNQKEIYERLSSVEYNQKNLSEDIACVSIKQQTSERKLNTLILDQKETKKVVEFNTSRIINLESTLTDQIKGLFDARSVNDNKHDVYEDHITTLNSKVFNLDVRTSALEDDVKKLKEA